MPGKAKQPLPALLSAICMALALAGCGSRSPILVGYSAELTGRTSELGVDGRDGAQLAVERINQHGGVNGRPIQLVVKDDRGDPATARQVDEELRQAKVVAIVGHLTSAMSSAVIEQNNAAKMVMISPTTSSAEFSKRDDYFFRVTPDTDLLGRSMADYLYTNRSITSLVGVYDLRNRSYTQAWWDTFTQRYQKLGGTVEREFPFRSGITDLRTITDGMIAAQPKAVIFVTSAFDCALMMQYIRPKLEKTQFFSAAWAVTNELISKGGRSVDGMEMQSVFYPYNASAAYQNFAQIYQQRFGRQPSLAASHSYEAILVLSDALTRTQGSQDGLPEALKQIKDFPGLQGNITIDPYGDVERNIYMVRVTSGYFSIIKIINP